MTETDAEKRRKRIETLEEAVAVGAVEVEHEGKRIRYRSLSDMRSVLTSLREEESGTRTPSTITFATSKGL